MPEKVSDKLARILVVEDEAIVALSLKDKLEALGYKVVGIVSTGEEAVSLAGETLPSLVLMDIKLRGEMDGVVAAKKIRENFGLPVIYLTAFGNQDIMDRAKVTEPFGYILKPFHERELHIAIEMAIYRHKAERALRESEEKYRLLFSSGPVPLFVLDVKTRNILAANETALSHYGYTEEEVSDLTLNAICPECKSADNPYVGRWVHRKKGGEKIYVDMKSHRVKYIGMDAMLLHAVDVTKRVQAEQLLEKRQRALQGVYRIATKHIETVKEQCEHIALTLPGMLGADGVYVFKSAGVNLTLLAGVVEGKLIESEGKISSADIFENEMAEGSRVTEEVGPFFEYPGSELFSREAGSGTAMTVPVLDAESRLLGAICVIDDSGRDFGTEDVLVAEIFARYIAHEIEREKLSASLAEAQKMEVIGKLTGGVAHEVRNPLNAIMAITDALAKDLESNEEYGEFLYHMRLQVDRLSALMNDMLDLGKPAERLHFQNEKVRRILDSVMSLWMHSPVSKLVKVKMSIPEDVRGTEIFCDLKRMQQIFLNLLENAAQHSPKESEIGFNVCGVEGGIVNIQVVDAGVGILEDIDRIFEPFYSTRRGGTGLGLSIVKHFIDHHGGNVSAWNNTSGQGLTVEVQLPVHEPRMGADK